MSTEGFALSLEAGVREIALDRPDRKNPLDYGAVTTLVQLLREADADPQVRSVLLRGNGSCFCSGGDLREFQQTTAASAFDLHETGQVWADLMTTIPRMTKPVVAAVHGYALAGGCGLVAAADVAIAAEGTKLGVSEIRIGLFPIIVYPTLVRAVGPRRARELALTGRRIDADEALGIGLVHRVVAADALLDEARALAADLAGLGPDALRLGKELMRSVADLPLEEATAFARAMRGAFMVTPDIEEGIAAFLEKRPPRFGTTAG